MTTTTLDRPLPRSYMPEEDKVGMSQNAIYLCESADAKEAGDEEASWAWLALAKLPESASYILKEVCGDEFLKSKGFRI
ncbi:MAG: hypothetical protein LBU53_05835 [Zoogloeaceae bacterium]|jgi:hypothetical protein|nr:hypothetical protein [Zoogloeaceae bacterium]